MDASKLHSLGNEKIMSGDLLGGLECFREALRLDPDNYDLYWSYYTWLEEAIIEVPAFAGDAILCLTNMFLLMERDDRSEKNYSVSRYWDLATSYFRNYEFEKALDAAKKAIELGSPRMECRVFEAYGLKYLNQDYENKYENVCNSIIEDFAKKIFLDKMLKACGATPEQLEALKNTVSYEFPMELVKYFQTFLPVETVEWKKETKLLSHDDIIKENSTSSLAKLGFFTFAKVGDDYSICMDLVDELHPIYQCSNNIIAKNEIHFPGNDDIHLELNYENVKKVSILSEMNLALFLNNLKNGYITLRDEKDMEHQYGYNKYLVESGFKTLDVTISEKKKEDVNKVEDEEKETDTNPENAARYAKMAEKMIEVLKQKTSKKCLKFKLKPGNPTILDTKVGGVPFIPENGEYPVSTENGEMLYLLAQINFEQIPHLPDYPTKGILQFFIGSDDLYGCDYGNYQEQKSWRIIYHEDISNPMDTNAIKELMDNQKKPEDVMLPFEKTGTEYFIELVLSEEPISIDDFRFEETFLKECKEIYLGEFGEIGKSFDLPDGIWDVLYEKLNGFGSKIGGYPGFTQFDPRDDDDMSDYQLLFQLDSECKDGEWYLMWGDSGVANFFITLEDLKKCDFSKVIYNWDCA